MPRNNFSNLLVMLTLFCTTSVQAEIYKWVDANGVTHYGDSAPDTSQRQPLDFGQLRRPAAAGRPTNLRSPANTTGLSFPGKPRKVTHRVDRPKKTLRQTSQNTPSLQAIWSANQPDPSIKKIRSARQTLTAKKARLSKRVSKPLQPIKVAKVNKTLRQKPKQKAFKEIQLAVKSQLNQAPPTNDKPNLDAEEYDFRSQPKHTKKKTIKNVKQKLCNEKRMLLAALQEKGFNSYFDEEGHFRLAWGGDGIYQGKRRFLNDEEVAKKTEKVIFEVGQYCDNPNDYKLQETARANWIRAEYCTVSKAVLEDLEHPFMRSTDSDIKQQTEKVKRHCSELAPGRYRNDNRYYPKALKSKVVLPRHLMLKEHDDATETAVKQPKETIKGLLTLIE